MAGLVARWVVVLGACLVLVPRLANAQLFSPGELIEGHAKLEGLRNCTKCHEAGEKLANKLCLDCHTEIASTVRAGRGLHGRAPVSTQSCESCHHEHQGRSHDLAGLGKPSAFDHARTGWQLQGAHQKLECNKCHEPRFVGDEAVRKLFTRAGGKTYLGLSTSCASCHFDEHRGQVGAKCESCHGTDKWKPAKGFSHSRTKFALRGKHARVGCAKCHATREDTTTAAQAFPAPVRRAFLQLSDVAHGSCATCHDDPHDGKLGRRCESCHSVEGWHVLTKGAKDAGFHDKTRFPLRGGHVGVECKHCHGPFGRKRAVFKGLAFDTCERCHVDAHAQQLTPASTKASGCERCHSVDAFMPPAFGVEEHATTNYPLQGAHRAVACNACHQRDDALATRVAPALRRQLAEQGRELRLSLARFDFPKGTQRCDACHVDPHQGQLAGRAGQQGCDACHDATAFTPSRFDHDKDSRFALTGAHRDAKCGRCHSRAQVPGTGKRAIIYRPVPTDCAACHTDVHLGQLRTAEGGATDCARCHGTQRFTPVTFDHSDPEVSRFVLAGRHLEVACSTCHTKVAVDSGHEVARLRPLPLRCAECHVDQHQGAFTSSRLSELTGQAPAAGAETPCEVCHEATAWSEVRFTAHDRTSFPLRGEHARAACDACHIPGAERVAVHDCASCHADPHAGELGARCDSCHDAQSWEGRFDAAAHRRTRFPLVGRHGTLPCQECHPGAARGFVAPAVECASCHEADYARTALGAVDHGAAGFSRDCLSCHDAWSFRPARFPGHELCFQIDGGPHGGVSCRECHTSVPSIGVSGACSSGTAACSGCHEHRCAEMDEEHAGVPGYQCRDAKCYACHEFTR